jgi:tetratricopeptide (TPR) repeat protein
MRTPGLSRSIASALLLALAGCTPEVDVASQQRQAGDEQWKKGAYQEAAAAYEKSLAADPKQEKVLERLAMCRVRLDDRNAAATTLLKVLDLKTDAAGKAEVYRNVAGVYLQGQDAEHAEKYLQEIVKLLPNDEAALTWLGELAAQRGGARSNDAEAVPEQLDLALGYYDKLIALKPDSLPMLAHKRIVLTKYVNHITARLKAFAESQKAKGKAKPDAEAVTRIEKLKTRDAELRATLAEVEAKVAALRKKPADKPATAK